MILMDQGNVALACAVFTQAIKDLIEKAPRLKLKKKGKKIIIVNMNAFINWKRNRETAWLFLTKQRIYNGRLYQENDENIEALYDLSGLAPLTGSLKELIRKIKKTSRVYLNE